MGAADAYQHTDSNRNDDGSNLVHGTLKMEIGYDDGSNLVHGTLKMEIGFGESSSNPILLPMIITQKVTLCDFFAEKLAFIRNYP